MSVDLKVPAVGESISSVVVGEWLVQPGQSVAQDTILVVLETDKVNVEVPAPVSGKLSKVLVKSGESASIGDTLGVMEEGSAPARSESKPAAPPKETVKDPSPAAKRALHEAGLKPEEVKGSGKDGQVLKEDVPARAAAAPAAPTNTGGGRQEEVVTMSPLRKTIARRLIEAQSTAALLTTFNEVDMSAVMELRKSYQDSFTAKHGTKLGFMSFFVKATIEALKAFPAVNAEVREQAVVYKNYFDIGVAVGGGKGLVVPILRNAERLSFADIEKSIKDFGQRAQEGKIKLEELQGGTFTISNGGVYGSLLSTPIVNPPQSGVLGLHKIEDRAVVRQGQVVVRPMMYLALTYDHRLVDGREAVSFLVRIKECMENPSRILLEV
ncbi:MAG: 2-oxoglutarate dehydrogenase complex dihydrolipoyllysine-residue succinyltransferase [Candidatus Eremiobacteraeota bacterium]|nr:2-oxoglutarate dehydrogenase complex dihydrolipoyllysine-residue succinyltransferase [Candidatus Eremiobacteraeota bacterium]MCW5868178.1 2-oxoglutarate dehydrogenase complex dihydrolipoyllysine-residue succinyltransferase [Candidatus Eremiobacteraeota bacterium]